MAKAITDRTHNFVERIGIDVESSAADNAVYDCRKLVVRNR
jgi:hypothetical protein